MTEADGEVLATAATVLTGRRAIDAGIAELILDPFDRAAAERVRYAQECTASAHQALTKRVAAAAIDPFLPRPLEHGAGADASATSSDSGDPHRNDRPEDST